MDCHPPKTRLKLTAELRQKVNTLRNQGLMRKDIASTLNITIGSVHGILGGAPPLSHEIRSSRVRKYTPEQEAEVIQLRQSGTAIKEVKSRTGLSKACIKKICHKAKILLTPEQLSINKFKPFSDETKEKAIELRKTGLSLPKISSQTGIPRNTLKGWFAKAQITIPIQKRWDNRDQAITPEAKIRGAEKRKGPLAGSAKIATLKYGQSSDRYTALAIKNGGKYLGPQGWVSITSKVQWKCKENHEFEMTPGTVINQDSWCPFCAKGASKGESQIFDLVKSICPDAILRDRDTLKPYEIDIFIPSKSLGIEYSGLHWHGELRHENKFNIRDKHVLANNKNIQLITILEDEWVNRKEATENFLTGVLGHRNRIGARNLTIRKGRFKSWVEKNHLQGHSNGIDYGLCNGDDLLAVATFARPNASRARKDKGEGTWELSRYCIGPIGVTGGLSRLMGEFHKDHPECKELLSYSDNRWSQGTLYEATGFTKIRLNRPSYWYFTHEVKRIHRFSLRKSVLIKRGGDPRKTEWQLAQEAGYDRIWDAGTILWSKTFSK